MVQKAEGLIIGGHMKRQKIQLIIILIFLFLTAAAYGGMKYYNENHTEEEEKISYTVTEVDTASVKELSLSNENGDFSFVKENDVWYEAGDRSVKIDTALLENMITAATGVTSEDKIENVEDMSEYGLENPQIAVTYSTETENVTLNIGDYNSAVSKYYICVDGENTVYTISSSVRSSFTKSLDDLKAAEADTGDNGGESPDTDKTD